MGWKLNSDTGLGKVLEGVWERSDACIPVLFYAPIEENDGYLPYAYRPYTPAWKWQGDPHAMIMVEKGDQTGKIILYIEKRFLHPADGEDRRSLGASTYGGVFEHNPLGEWRCAAVPEMN